MPKSLIFLDVFLKKQEIMKPNVFSKFLTLAFIVLTFNSFAYNYAISGGVFTNDGKGIANQLIVITSGNSNTMSQLETKTDENGLFLVDFSFEEGVTNTISISYTDNCGIANVRNLTVSEKGSSKFNFNFCKSNDVEICKANFYYKFSENQSHTVLFFNESFSQDSTYSLFWDFGDNTVSTETNPTHTFTADGDYLVRLKMSSETCSAAFEENIWVGNDSTITIDFCSPYFWYMPSTENPLVIIFQNESYSMTNDVSASWDFGDGTTSNDFNPKHLYEKAGTYNVSLTIKSSMCQGETYTSTVFVDTDIIIDECATKFYYETDDSGYNFNFYSSTYSQDSTYSLFWDFGDNTVSTETNPTHTFTADGNFLVRLKLVSETCSTVAEQYVYVGVQNWYPESCQAFFYPEYNWEDAHEINFVDFSYGKGEILSHKWDFGDGTGSNLQNPSHIFGKNGEYLITLTIESDNCSSSFSQYIYVKDANYNNDCKTLFFPEFDGSLDVKFFDLSMPEPVSWSWTFSDNGISTEQNPIHSFNDVGIYYITLETATDSSCYSAFKLEIELYEIATKSQKTYGGKVNAAYAIESTKTNINRSINLANSIKFYPNPVQELLNVELDNDFENAQIQIYSSTGQVIYSQEINNTKVDINTSDFASGVYIARLKIDNEVTNFKFVKGL